MATDVERARWRGTAMARVTSRLQVGVEWNAAVSEVGPLLTGFLVREGPRTPAVFLGTSSDRIGSPEGEQAYYATAAKRASRLPVSAYVTLNYSTWDDGWNVPFGVTAWIGTRVSFQPMYDGERSHLMATYAGDGWSVSFLAIGLEEPGLSLSWNR